MSSKAAARDIVSSYKRTFLRGLATMLPTVLTLWVVIAAYEFVDGSIAAPISEGIKTRLVETDLGNEVVFSIWDNLELLRKPSIPPPASADQADVARYRDALERIETAEPSRREALRREIDRRFPGWVGFLFAVIAVFVVGFFMASFLGSWLLGLVESWAGRIPLVRNVYPGAKQMVDFFLKSDGTAGFQAVVACEFPRRGLWSIGFLTCDNIPEVEVHGGERVRGVYLGTPAAGQIVLARESEIIPIDMTVDEALKFLFSGGVVGRDPERPPKLPELPFVGRQPPARRADPGAAADAGEDGG